MMSRSLTVWGGTLKIPANCFKFQVSYPNDVDECWNPRHSLPYFTMNSRLFETVSRFFRFPVR